ncbi:MAG TPA: MBL fold metallo-hydrolase [Bacteroidota bacterium]|nr:MBL fold metallo-hydrolase [Bacteroidota bacterium]
MVTRRRFFTTTLSTVFGARSVLSQVAQRRHRLADMLANDQDPSVAPARPDPASWDNSALTAAWIGHSTILINFFGINIITDPVLSERIGLNIAGLFTIGPRRLVQPSLAFEDLPRIDLILISHAHWDHLDTPTVKRFDRSIPVVMAKGTADIIEDFEFQKVYELDWGHRAVIGALTVEALPVKHFGWRYPWEQDRSRGNPDGRSYNAYLLSHKGRHIVFGGDTAYLETFRALRTRQLPIDLAMMPIGAYDPWITNHATPEQSLAMTDQMGSSAILPMHWGTFIQSEEPTTEPIERLRQALGTTSLCLALEAIGQTWSVAAPGGEVRGTVNG